MFKRFSSVSLEGAVPAEVPAIRTGAEPETSNDSKRKIIKLANGNELDLDSIKVSQEFNPVLSHAGGR